jgi:hypothetical protein
MLHTLISLDPFLTYNSFITLTMGRAEKTILHFTSIYQSDPDGSDLL